MPPVALAEEEAATVAEMVIETEESEAIEDLSPSEEDGILQSPPLPDSAPVGSGFEADPNNQNTGGASNSASTSDSAEIQLVSDKPTPSKQSLGEPTPSLVSEPFNSHVQPTTHTWKTVELNKTYVYPYNDQVGISFTKLPESIGSLTIQEVALSDAQKVSLGAYTSTAYDITSSMPNGSFEYELKLPMPEAASNLPQVVFAESVADLDKFQAINTDKISVDGDNLTVSELDHFTVFVITGFEEVQTTSTAVGYNSIWFADDGATITQVPSGTDGIVSSEGTHHAKTTGYAFTRWDGYKSVFPVGGYSTRLDVYLDMNLANGTVDKRFNYTSAINDSTGNHRRDFIFHLGTNPTVANQWLASVSNNAPGWPGNSARSPLTITESDWYTLEHVFSDAGGALEVTLNIYKKGALTPMASWTLSDPSDLIGTTVGGNRYGWITSDFGFDWLAIDRAEIEYASAPINEHYSVVRPSFLDGWNITTTGSGQVQMTDSSIAILGDGLLNLTTQADVEDRARVIRTEDVALSDVYQLGYKTHRSSGFGLEGNAAYRLLIDADGETITTTDRATLMYEPYWQDSASPDSAPVQQDVWQSWDVEPGLFWASIPGGNSVSGLTNGSGGPPFYTLQNVLTLHPDARVIAVSVAIGSYNTNYDIDVDDVVFGYKTDSSIEVHRYDFEADLPAPTPVATIDLASLQMVENVACGIGSALTDDGLTVNITNWQAGYVLQGRYFTSGGSFSGWFNLGPWGTFSLSGSDASFFADNSGNSSSGPAGWEVRVLDASSAVVSNVDSANYTITTDPSALPCDAVAPALPIHQYPSNNGIINTNDFYFQWTDVTDAVEYEFQSSTNPAVNGDGVLTTGVWNNKLNGSGDQSYLTESEIHSVGANGTWYWQVRARDAAGNWSAWTSPWTMTIDMVAPAAPVIVFPNPEDYFPTQPILNDWTDVIDASGIHHYQIEYLYDDGHSFSGGPFRESVVSQRNHAPAISEAGGVQFRVRAYDNAGNIGPWSEWRHYWYLTQPSAKLIAQKVVCKHEADLPNNTLGTSFGASTAAEFVAASDGNCIIDEDWQFQWAPSGAGTFDSFQTSTTALTSPWTTFVAGTEVSFTDLASLGGRIEVREVFPDEGDYVPFSNGGNVSAELWCSGDGANYDNWEWINAPEYGQTYHCVAFNALAGETEPTPPPSTEPTPTPTTTPMPQSNGSVLGASNRSNGKSGKASPPDCSEFNPSVPFSLSAIATGGSVSLNWSDIPQADSYVLRVLPPGGSEYGLQGISSDTNALTLTNLNLGTHTFEMWGQDDCHPSPRATATATIITATFGEGAGGPIAVLPGGEEVLLAEGSVEGVSDELTDEEIAALENEKGLVAGLTDETCQRSVTPWLPVIFLAVMSTLALLVEILMRSPSIAKILTLSALTASGIFLFYWLGNCDCQQGGETITQLLTWLCQWFWIAAILLALLLRGVGFSFIQSEDD